MSNELSKAIKRKTDAQFRTMGEDRTPSVSEGAGGSVIILDPGQYQIPYVAGKNVTIGTSGNNKVINAVMNVLAGQNITVGEPDPDTGAVTISSSGTYMAEDVAITDIAGSFTSGNVEGALSELFTSVSSGKVLVAGAITDKGVPTPANASFSTMAENVSLISSGGGGYTYGFEIVAYSNITLTSIDKP